MTTLFKQSQSAHWYSQSGAPCHEVPKADGKGMKKTTLREARKLQLLPSCTTILKLYPRYDLDNWIKSQIVLSAITLPRLPDEGDDAFALRVVADSESQASKAAEFGGKIHNCIAGDPVTEDIKPWMDVYQEWESKNIQRTIWQEEVLVNLQHGYAGRGDRLAVMNGSTVLMDFKCRTVKDVSKPPVYHTDLMQLVAYAQCASTAPMRVGLPTHLCSVIINSVTPSEPIVHIWPDEEIEGAWLDFLACLNLFKRYHRYEPVMKAVEV